MNRSLILLSAGFFAAAGCAAHPRRRTAAVPKPPAQQAAPPIPAPPVKPADLAAQKALYEEGLKFYSEEKYLEAKKSWEQALEISTTSELSGHILENLKKTDQVLKTLQEIQGKKQGTDAAPPKPRSGKEGPSR